MKRKNSKKSVKSDANENGVGPDEEVDSGEEPQEKKGRKSKGRKSKGKAVEEEAEIETGQSEDDTIDDSRNQNGNNQEKKGRKSKGKKSKQGKAEESEPEQDNTAETDPLADDDDDDAEYEVEAILDEKMVKGVRHYLIRWKGYTEESDTWEPEKTLDCDHLMKEYKENKKKEKSKPPTKQKAKKAKRSSEQGGDWDENENFEVDRILDVYFHRDGKRDFLVSWKGYPASQNSWEPEDNMDCKDLIKRYMEKVDQAKKFEGKESKLRVNPKPVNRLEFSMHERSRRLSKRRGGKDRVHYFDAD